MPNFNNNYGFSYPYGAIYQPFMPQQNQQANQNYNNMYQAPQQNQQPQFNQYAFVNGIEGAKSFQLQPNQTILLMDSDAPICYMKTSNGVGQSTLRYFRLAEVSESELKNDSQPKPQEPSPEYALKTDIEALTKRLDDLSKKIEKPFKKENSKQ